jgi:hypothetical protein
MSWISSSGRMYLGILLLVALPTLMARPTWAQDSDSASIVEEQPSSLVQTGLSEPTKCFRGMVEAGFEISVGLTIELCAGTKSASKTIACFSEAWGHIADNGLGLILGLAVDLCRAVPRGSR